MNSPSAPFVSVVIPCRNERAHIAACLDNIVEGDFPPERLEILVVDGLSDDGTREEVRAYAKRHPLVRLIDNPKQITPSAMNAGVRAARGDVIVRVDAHARYPRDYLRKLLGWMELVGADNVGGVLITRPGGPGPVAEAIAIAASHPFGVGNAYFRIGVRQPRWVDTVPFGCWRKSTFTKIGMFDEELLRNQDDELNFRLLKSGGKLLLAPDISIEYFMRSRLSQVWRMFWQYGYFKPLVARKVGGVVTARQLAPAALLVALALFAAAAPFTSWGFAGLLLALGAYALANLAASIEAARRPALIPRLSAAFAVIHAAYGSGFLRGMWDFFVRGPRAVVDPSRLRLSR